MMLKKLAVVFFVLPLYVFGQVDYHTINEETFECWDSIRIANPKSFISGEDDKLNLIANSPNFNKKDFEIKRYSVSLYRNGRYIYSVQCLGDTREADIQDFYDGLRKGDVVKIETVMVSHKNQYPKPIKLISVKY